MLRTAAVLRPSPACFWYRIPHAPNHHQERIHKVHRLGLEPFPVVFAAVACRHDGNAGIHNLAKLRLR